MDIPQELVKQIAKGNSVLFVGAGLSKGAGLPGWNDLLAPLAANIGVPANTDPLKIAQYYEVKRGRQALIDHIIEQMDTTGKRPTENHRLLARLPIQTWVTTNYDNVLEKTLDEAGKSFRKVVRDHELPYTGADTVTLVKLHGDREQPDTIVITLQDYYTYFRRFPRVKDELTALLIKKTFLFIGYSVSDPDFNQLQAEIAFDLEKHQRRAYAILFNADEFTVDILRSLNIHVINIPMEEQENYYSERLGEVLQKLVHDVNSQSVQRHLQRAAEYRQQRNFEKEIQELDQALDLAPEDLDIKKQRANACLRRAYQCEKESDFVKMRDWFDEARSVYGKLGLFAEFQEAEEGKQKAHLKLAEQSLARGNYKDAKDNLDQVQPDIPGYEGVRRQLRQETSLE